ncbi:nucleoside triphosphate pyrophosphohydrolase [Elongatibacter sediminis]|uniref:Nucleoside triphosphate pyrophosphohydrolase n=1 Tax=Elongatibacter sediminis TaxID=3119006 RepID=A0AAW9R886_9GAMM
MNNDIGALLDIMQRLRDPEKGCSWDREQTFETIAPYTVEEAYEVADAIERRDLDGLRDELGDLLLQVVFHSQMASEQNAFSWSDVVSAICDKMVRRHPHVFGNEAAGDRDDMRDAWEHAKERERSDRGATSLMDEIPRGMAELQRAMKLQKRAARAGFDWPSAEPVLDKLDEETAEVREAMAGGDADRVEDEVGDLFFVVVNLARKLSVDPGSALRRANAKFEKRFRQVEILAGGRAALDEMDLGQMEDLWVRAKKNEGVSNHE